MPSTVESQTRSGVSVEAEVTCREGRFRENVLFTHRGLSGPAILQISSYWDGGDRIHIDLLPDIAAGEWLGGHLASAMRLDTLLAERLPKRLAQQWCAAHDAALIERLCKVSPLPVNILMRPGCPDAKTLAVLGVARISHGHGPWAAAMDWLTSKSSDH